MELARRKYFYNRCKPLEALDPDDPRYVRVDEMGDPDHRVRGENWVGKLARRVELSAEPVCELLTGLPGSGKSTELRRLAAHLARPDGANLLPVLIDADETLDLANPIDIPDVIFSILHAAEEALLAVEGKPTGAAMREGYLTRFWAWISRTDVELNQGHLTVADPLRLVLELKTRPTLRARVRAAAASHLSRLLEEARDELLLMQARAERLGRAGLVVIVDSLEKLRGVSANWNEVLQSAEQVFAGGAPYLRLPVHAFYTIPTALITRRRFEQVHFMPMIKLAQRDGTPFELGMDAAYALVLQRVPVDALREVFGDHLEPRMKRLISWSGGYPRELVRLLQAALGAESLPLSDSAFERVLNEVGDQYRRMIPATAFPWLARVALEQELTLEDDEHRQVADAMLSNNAILRYLNDRDWYDLHPAVKAIPGVAAELTRLQRGSAGAP